MNVVIQLLHQEVFNPMIATPYQITYVYPSDLHTLLSTVQNIRPCVYQSVHMSPRAPNNTNITTVYLGDGSNNDAT